MTIENMPDFDILNQRSANSAAWLDEITTDVITKLCEAINAPTAEAKDTILVSATSWRSARKRCGPG